ncbi:hypothetical protein [Oleidesulfovibrio sp.]|uniref:hypothetical protein n=1 Tax=Oleidesulfovibrio sp. TaxID=2909707 RepID=UPI003A8876AA
MDYMFLLLASLSAAAVLFTLFRRKSQEFNQAIHQLERKNAQLNLHLSQLADEETRLGESISSLEGQIKLAAMEASFTSTDAESTKDAMRFMDYLVHRGGITTDQLKKVERYKAQTGSPMSYEELLIMLDMITREKLQSMKDAFDKMET